MKAKESIYVVCYLRWINNFNKAPILRFLKTKVHIKCGEYSIHTKIYRIYRNMHSIYTLIFLNANSSILRMLQLLIYTGSKSDINPF